ncbi:MAG: hypothetical protein J7647_06535 [Cyanobacteria bacterium SBLK]|nr:hypothetical protein [Cyanobacteria bacterium SBLK]
MSESEEIRVKPHQSVLKKEIKVDPKALLLAIGKTAVSAGLFDLGGVLKGGVDILGSLGGKNSPQELAGLLIFRALFRGMKELIDEHLDVFREGKPKDLQGLTEALQEAIARGDLAIDRGFFEHPKNCPLVKEVKAGFRCWLDKFVKRKIDAENISDRLPAYFVFALSDEWRENRNRYVILQDELDTPFVQAKERERGWLRYRAWLQKQIEEPIFFESFGLKQIYIPLRAYYDEESDRDELEGKLASRRGEEKVKRMVVDLQQELESWLQDAKADDAIRLMSGGPGSGKSSFAKMLAAKQAETGDIPVLFIPLHRFKVSEDLIKAVADFVTFDGHLFDNPLDKSDRELRLFIIFDGLDELSMQGKLAQETASKFVDEVRFLVSQFNSYTTRLQVLISGREVVVQAYRDKFRTPCQLLYLLPYFVPKKEREKYYNNAEKLLEQDGRDLWWRRYGAIKNKNYQGFPDELNRDNLLEITAQPLLNYLLALSYERDQLEFSADTNLNEIYADLLDAVYERGYEGKREHIAIQGLKQYEFFGILEEIALACWHGDGRTTTVGEIEKHCEDSGFKQILERFQKSLQEDSTASITRLLTAFYFRESGELRGTEKTFEFTHKSFGEYLTARRIVEGLKLIQEELEERSKNPRKGCDRSGALSIWLKLCGESAIDEYLFNFIVGEIRLQNLELVQEWQKTLFKMIEFMLIHGMPLEGLKERPHFQEEMRLARNSEEALLIVLGACSKVTKKPFEKQFYDDEIFELWMSKLKVMRFLEHRYQDYKDRV